MISSSNQSYYQTKESKPFYLIHQNYIFNPVSSKPVLQAKITKSQHMKEKNSQESETKAARCTYWLRRASSSRSAARAHTPPGYPRTSSPGLSKMIHRLDWRNSKGKIDEWRVEKKERTLKLDAIAPPLLKIPSLILENGFPIRDGFHCSNWGRSMGLPLIQL